MSFSDLFDSGFKQRNAGHFAAIVRLAMSDEIITNEERAFLDRLANKLDISDRSYQEILKEYQSHPINPPITYDSRLERLYDLGRIVYADQELGKGQIKLLERLSVGLGFSTHNVKYVVDKALSLIANAVGLDTFKEEIRLMNR